ncbi:MAG: hypothetical protein KDD44_10725, partial [Bdellovibrionales bacterium]|nr:hypothetical protein [Bdellovibrionales bacterium]
PEVQQEVANVFLRSFRHARENISSIVPALCAHNRSRGADITSEAEMRKYLDRYGNDDTESMDEACQRALRVLAGESCDLDFVSPRQMVSADG